MNDPFYSPKQDRHLRLVPEEDLLLAKKRIAELEANADLFELQQTIILDTERSATLEAQVRALREALECCEVVLSSIGHSDLACCISARAALAATEKEQA